MNRHCIPGLTMSAVGTVCRSVRIIKTMHTGFGAYTYYAVPALQVLAEEAGRYDLAWKDLCNVLRCSVNSNELSKV